MNKATNRLIFIFFLLIGSTHLSAQQFDNVQITELKITDNIYMLKGAGGNIGLLTGEEGSFIIDDQFAPLSEKIISKIKTISPNPIVYVANTHFHGDHTGGNENFNELGVTIIAQNNVRKRLMQPGRDGKTRPKSALPVITFSEQLNVYFSEESIMAFHVDKAHTDGDTILFFADSNVLHTGDTYFNGRYPYIDLNSGGSIDGYINAVKKGLMLIDENTKIIPGHGDLSNYGEYKAFLDMLVDLRTRVNEAINQGQSEDEIINNTDITKTYDDLGFGSGFINSERIRKTIYTSLINNKS